MTLFIKNVIGIICTGLFHRSNLPWNMHIGTICLVINYVGISEENRLYQNCYNPQPRLKCLKSGKLKVLPVANCKLYWHVWESDFKGIHLKVRGRKGERCSIQELFILVNTLSDFFLGINYKEILTVKLGTEKCQGKTVICQAGLAVWSKR